MVIKEQTSERLKINRGLINLSIVECLDRSKSQHGLGLAIYHEKSLFQAVATMAMLVFCFERIIALGGT